MKNNNLILIPKSVDTSRLDDKMAYFVHHLYTFPFQYKHKVKSWVRSQKNILKRESTGDWSLSYKNVGRYSSNSSGIDLAGGCSSSSYVFTSDIYYSKWDGFVPIHTDWLIKYFTTKDYSRVRMDLLNQGIINCDWSYSNFDSHKFPMKYALNDVHRFSAPMAYDLSNKRFRNKIAKFSTKRRSELSPLLQELEKKIFNIEFDYKSATEYVKKKSYKKHKSKGARDIGISIMRNRPSSNYFIYEGPNCRRVFSPITSLPGDLRPFITYQDNLLLDVDISAALPTLFNYYLLDLDTEDVKLYRHLTSEAGNDFGIYEYLKELWNEKVRDDVKKLTMVLFFGKGNTIREYRRKFDKSFPSVHKRIKHMKKESYKILANTLMQMEREIMIDCVAKELLESDPSMALLTIHDGILTTEEFTEKVKGVIVCNIKDRIGQIPKVKIELLEND